ncbi:MAG TPA: hypothetical protein VFQ53_25995 [Kofleriaceae bacterium]|nr:hypothetical protein [Kofleriaceae bacterium]
MRQLADTAAATRARDWPRALELALAVWRDTRLPELADVIDRIGEQCTIEAPPRGYRDVHGWWMRHAAPYQPAAVSTLAAYASYRVRASDTTHAEVAARWPRDHIVRAITTPRHARVALNLVDRLAAIRTWPADPRIAARLAQWLATYALVGGLRTIYPTAFAAIADVLVAIADRRVLDRLAVCRDAWRDTHVEPLRRMRDELARAHDAIDDRAWTATAELLAETAELAALVDASVVVDLDRLWREIAERPDDDAPRAVLADALIARHDTRGELIALQLAIAREPETRHARDRRVRRVARLLAVEWERYLGDVALVIQHAGSEVRRGMLEVVRAGLADTPGWAWRAVRGHRELATVRTVRAGHVTSTQGYAAFVAGLPNLRSVQIDSTEIVEALALEGARLPITHLEYTQVPHWTDRRVDARPVAPAIHQLARIAPQLQHVTFDARAIGNELPAVVAAMPSQFPALDRVVIDAPASAIRELVHLSKLPFVAVRSGP